MAVTNQELFNIFLANPNMSDAQIVSLMEKQKISPAQVSQTFGIPEGQISARVAATIPPGNSVTLGDTVIVPQYQTTGSGENEQIGALEGFATSKSNGDPNYKAPVGTPVQLYSADGEFVNTVKTKKDLSFFGGMVDMLKDPVVQAAILGVAGGGLLGGGAPTALGAEGLTLGELGFNANNLATATNVADVVAGANASGLLTGGAAGAEAATAFELVNAGIAGGTATFTPAQLALIEAGASAAEVAAAGSGLLTGGKTAAELAAEKLTTDTATKSVVTAGTKTAAEIAADKVITDAAKNAVIGAGTTLLNKSVADTASGLFQTTGSLLQSKESKDAALKAAQDIIKATQTGVEASQFRPVGMTTRFGTSNYTYDPVTGRMTSAGYQLSPEAKNAQDRLVKLAESGLQQVEQARSQFAPLQTAAQNLYSLGSQYIAKSPEEAAQDYINKQMQLLAPSRELDLANLQNKLFQQGRTGVSVAQGGTLGATTPELQALYNARALQDLQLSSQAQQAGQANTLFGSNLYDLGTAKLSNYYSGQQAAYAPYTTALGQIQGLETAAQQPLQMGATLGQQASVAGFNAGRLGLQGAQISGNLMTSPAVTNNAYAAFLSGLGSPTSTLGQGLANYITGYNPTADQNAVLNPYLTPTSVWYG